MAKERKYTVDEILEKAKEYSDELEIMIDNSEKKEVSVVCFASEHVAADIWSGTGTVNGDKACMVSTFAKLLMDVEEPVRAAVLKILRDQLGIEEFTAEVFDRESVDKVNRMINKVKGNNNENKKILN